MTAQILKKGTVQEASQDPAFLLRWLNGTLSEDELSSLRNREEYEEMAVVNKKEPVLLPEKILSEPGTDSGNESTATSEGVSKSSVFPTFALIAVALIGVTSIFVKLGGWW